MVDGTSIKVSDSIKMQEVDRNILELYYKPDNELKINAAKFRLLGDELKAKKSFF